MKPARFATVLLFVASTAFAQDTTRMEQAPDPRSMGGGDCRDSAYNCADAPNPLPAPNTVWIEEMTWMDVRDSLKAGHTNCEAIARKLGNALCAKRRSSHCSPTSPTA